MTAPEQLRQLVDRFTEHRAAYTSGHYKETQVRRDFIDPFFKLIANVMDKVGKDGVITVEESKSLQFETEYVEGMQFDRGYISAYFITDSEHMESIISEPYILIYDKKISAAQDIVPLLEKLVQVGKRELVIIAEDVDGEALAREGRRLQGRGHPPRERAHLHRIRRVYDGDHLYRALRHRPAG